jgi:hypothetical protein
MNEWMQSSCHGLECSECKESFTLSTSLSPSSDPEIFLPDHGRVSSPMNTRPETPPRLRSDRWPTSSNLRWPVSQRGRDFLGRFIVVAYGRGKRNKTPRSRVSSSASSSRWISCFLDWRRLGGDADPSTRRSRSTGPVDVPLRWSLCGFAWPGLHGDFDWARKLVDSLYRRGVSVVSVSRVMLVKPVISFIISWEVTSLIIGNYERMIIKNP